MTFDSTLTLAEQRLRFRENVLIVMALGFLAVDALTGAIYWKLGLNSNLSILYKVIFLVICLEYLLKTNIKLFLLSFSCLAYATIYSLAHNYNGEVRFFIKDFGDLIKLSSVIIVFSTFSMFTFSNGTRNLNKLILATWGVLIVNIMSSILGVGQSTYGSFGAKGFFQSGNSLSAIIVLIATTVLFASFQKSKLNFMLNFIVLLICAILVGTKSSILGIFIVVGVVIFLNTRFYVKNTIYLLVIFGLLLLVVVFLIERIEQSFLYQRIVYFYETGGVVRALLSDRDLFFSRIWPLFENSGLVGAFFGLGSAGLDVVLKPKVEMDLVDIIFGYGLLPLSFYIVGLFFVLITLIRLPVNNRKSIKQLRMGSITSFLILTFLAFLSGHVFLNGVVTFLWGIVLASPIWEYNFAKRFR